MTLEILISSSVLILILAGLRLVLRGRISARLQYALWLLVLIRLLVPVSFFRSPLSVAEAAAPVTERVEHISDTALSMGVIPEPTDTAPNDAGPGLPEIVPARTLRDVAREVRFAGMGGMAAWFFFVNIRLSVRLRRSRRPYDASSHIPIYVADGIPSPCLFGSIFHPAVYLTERAAEDEAQARQIIAHELTHYRHGDMLWALLRSVCLVVWWFDPLVWLAAALSRRDCELACDEGTIKALGEGARFEYGRTLVGMAKVSSPKPSDLLCGATGMTTGKSSLRERVARIANAPKTSVAVAVIVLLIAAIAVGCTFSGASDTAAGTAGAALEPMSTTGQIDGDAPPRQMQLAVFDPVSGDATSTVVSNEDEIQEMYDFYRFIREKSTLTDPASLEYGPSVYGVRFYDDANGFETDGRSTGFQLWDGGQFLLFAEEPGDTSSSVYFDTDGIYAELLEDIIDKYHSESAEAVFVGGEFIGSYDREYWDEVQRELGGFADPAGIDSTYEPPFVPDESVIHWALEDIIYSSDSWQFRYNGSPMANDPLATIRVIDAEGRTLWIMDDADALMIEEADGSITWATLPGGLDCTELINELLPWARGEYDPEQTALEIQLSLAEAGN